MPRRLAFHLLALTGLAALAGCKSAVPVSAYESVARLSSLKFENLSASGVVLQFEVEVNNPLPSELRLESAEYELASEGTQFVSGKARAFGAISPNSIQKVSVPVQLNFADLKQAIETLEIGSVIPFAGRLVLEFDPQGYKRIQVPLSINGDLPVPAVPEVAIDSLQWDELSLSRASALLNLHIWNRNDFPMELSRISYSLALGGVPVVRSTLAKPTSFAASEEKDVEVSISFSPQNVGFSILNILRGSGAGYELTGTMRVNSPFGAMSIPYRKAGDTVFKRLIPASAADAAPTVPTPSSN